MSSLLVQKKLVHCPQADFPTVQGRYEFLRPKVTSLARRVPLADEGMLAFLKCLLQVGGRKR